MARHGDRKKERLQTVSAERKPGDVGIDVRSAHASKAFDMFSVPRPQTSASGFPMSWTDAMDAMAGRSAPATHCFAGAVAASIRFAI
jgi:hypothetical protein